MIKRMVAIAELTAGMIFAGSDRPTERINTEVRRQLVRPSYLKVFDNVSYRVDGSTVTLFGHVTRPILKKDAERAVRRVEGVKEVSNRIEVLPLSASDDRLRHSLYRAIYGYPSLNRYAMPVQKPIRIIVKNGHVTLEGIVANRGDRDVVNIRASGVHGVFSVTNNLQVEKESRG